MVSRAQAAVAMHDALTGVKPHRVAGAGDGAAVADGFCLLERDEIHVDWVLMNPMLADILRANPDVRMGETLWGARPILSKDVPLRMAVVCGDDGHGPRTAVVAWGR